MRNLSGFKKCTIKIFSVSTTRRRGFERVHFPSIVTFLDNWIKDWGGGGVDYGEKDAKNHLVFFLFWPLADWGRWRIYACLNFDYVRCTIMICYSHLENCVTCTMAQLLYTWNTPSTPTPHIKFCPWATSLTWETVPSNKQVLVKLSLVMF